MIDEKTTQQPEEAGLPNEEPSPSPVPETGSQEPQEAQAPENQQQEPEEQEEAPASGVPEEMELAFHVSYDDVFSVLNLTDKYDGTQKKQKTRVGMLLLVMVLEIISFFQTRNGFILVLAVIFGAMAVYLQRRGFGVNHRIAKAFEEEEQQTLKVNYEAAWINGTYTRFGEMTVYEVDGALSMIYDGNRTFVVPQRLLSQEEWVQLTRKLKGLLGDRYFDKTSNSLNK